MSRKAFYSSRFATRAAAMVLLLGFVSAPFAFAQRTRLKPGMNFFSPQQDVELGRQVSQDAEKKIVMLNNQRVDDYLDRLGKRLAGAAPGEKYPYQFKCVNDASINAFALPGGFLYVNRGTIEAADNEAELAGVIGHEIGHVALRHGTNQASKSYLTQAPLAILGSFMGNNSVPAILAQIGTSFAASSILLKYSRDDERQADLMGAQILYDANYDPRYVAQFFEKLDSKGRGSDFFSSHPNPDNRIQNINTEVRKLGSIPDNAVNDTREFRDIKNLLRSLPPAPKADENQSRTSSPRRTRQPDLPSDTYQAFRGGNVSLRHPDNWNEYQKDQNLTLAPDGGIVSSGNSSALAYGVIMEVFTPSGGNRSNVSLKEATNQLIENMRRSDVNMRISKDQGKIRVGGKSALSQILTNDSPLGGLETDWLVTVLRPEGLLYFVFAAPEQEFADYQSAFQQILNSVRFSGQ
jgi:Zn-dependent protease with chaperone function